MIFLLIICENDLKAFLSTKNKDETIEASAHLVIIDDLACDQLTAAQLSDPRILNYYRQFLIKADRQFDFENPGLRRRITEAISRVFSGVSAVLDFQIVNLRPYDCSDESINKNCRIVELFLTVDTWKKMKNAENIDITIDR